MRELFSLPVNQVDELVHLTNPFRKIKLHGAMGKWHLYAVEDKPQFRTVKIYEYEYEDDKGILKTYYLPFPYTQFVLLKGPLHFQRHFYVTITNSPIKDLLKDQKYFPPLPNIYYDGAVCLGGRYPQSIENAIDLFWMMPFENRPEYPWKGPDIIDYKEMSGLDLTTICEIDWPMLALSSGLSRLLRHHLRDFV